MIERSAHWQWRDKIIAGLILHIDQGTNTLHGRINLAGLLLTGYGYRKGIIGRADLLAISGLACLFPLPAVLLSLFGLEVWRRLWIRRQMGTIPALPGLLLGMLVYVLMKMFW